MTSFLVYAGANFVAADYGPQYMPVNAGDIILTLGRPTPDWMLGTRLQDQRYGLFPSNIVRRMTDTDRIPCAFIVDVYLHLTCALGGDGDLILLVLPPEYYTPEGRSIVNWELLALLDGVTFRGAWTSWDRTTVVGLIY